MDINKYIVEKLISKPQNNNCGWYIYDLSFNKADITSNINESRLYRYMCNCRTGEMERTARLFRDKNDEPNILAESHCMRH